MPIDDSYSNPSAMQAMALAVALVSFIIVGTASSEWNRCGAGHR